MLITLKVTVTRNQHGMCRDLRDTFYSLTFVEQTRVSALAPLHLTTHPHANDRADSVTRRLPSPRGRCTRLVCRGPCARGRNPGAWFLFPGVERGFLSLVARTGDARGAGEPLALAIRRTRVVVSRSSDAGSREPSSRGWLRYPTRACAGFSMPGLFSRPASTSSRFAHRGARPGPLGRSWSSSALLVAVLALVDVPGAFAEPFLTCEFLNSGVSGTDSDMAVYGDVDGDGRTDLLARNDNGGFSIYKQTTARNFGSSVELMDSGTAGTTKAICPGIGPLDLDKDGYPDLIFLGKDASWRNGGTADLVYFGGSATSGSGTTTSVTLSGNENKFSARCAVGDLNGDGALDIAIVNIYFGQKDVVFLNQGARGFGSALQLSTSGFGHDIKIADIDKDGIADVIVSQSDGAGEYVLYGVGDGTFTDA